MNFRNNNKSLLISAFGIHMGGGLVLLKALLIAATGDARELLIDKRFSGQEDLQLDNTKIKIVQRNLRSRLIALFSIALRAKSTDILLCFNSLPPLARSRAYVITYVHAPHFVGGHIGITYPYLTRFRHTIERFWFKLGLRFTDEIWVQTDTMADRLLANHPACIVHVIPLVDHVIAEKLNKHTQLNVKDNGLQHSFFYPADGVGHKNHINLLLAWKRLARYGLFPTLLLTLRSDELSYSAARAGISLAELPNVVNLGRISREAVLEKITCSSALIFPSLAETFGLPLLEARVLGRPILASERDFVRDVCVPTETFDPESPRSIARAVRRFVTEKIETNSTFLSPSDFVKRLMKSPSG
jgi:glycosyltransferase involved in cell wall biosynthesis